VVGTYVNPSVMLDLFVLALPLLCVNKSTVLAHISGNVAPPVRLDTAKPVIPMDPMR